MCLYLPRLRASYGSSSILFFARSSPNSLSLLSRCFGKVRNVYGCIWIESHVQAAALCSSRGPEKRLHTLTEHVHLYQHVPRGIGVCTCNVKLLHCFSMVCASEKKSGEVGKRVRQQESDHGSVLLEVLDKRKEPKALTVGAKVVEAGKDVTSLLFILGGFTLMGLLFYYVGSEFFSSNSPSTIFTKALKRVKADERVQMVLGEPISGYGEQTGRNRRRHVSHIEYEVDGVTYMRMKFHVSGSKRKGEAFVDLKKNSQGRYECRFLYVELVGYPTGTIVLEDNR